MSLSEKVAEKGDLAKGNAYFLRGDYEKALEAYLTALKNSPDFFVHYENIGWCYERLDDRFNAKKYYKKALELNPNAIRAKFFVSGTFTIENGTIKNKPIFFPQIHAASAAIDKQALKDEYFEKKLHLQQDDFALIRIIGNDLYPRHKIGQSRENVAFILENERPFERCRKIWIVNRIFNQEELSNILALLEKHKQEYHVIPFVEDDYKSIGLDYSCLPSPDFLHSDEFEKLSSGMKQRALVSLLRLKNNYVMNNNGARNYALNLGKSIAKWVLPWDGNCFLNKASWDAIVKGVLDEPYLKHFVVPMARITSNDLMLNDTFIPEATEEPQIIIRNDSREKFNADFSYGRRPKVELFWRLGIPGPWDNYKDDRWDIPRLPPSPEAHQFGITGWTARLFSGMAEQESQDNKGSANRNSARQLAICLAIQAIDEKVQPDIKIDRFYETMEKVYGCQPKKNPGDKFIGKTIVYVHRSDGLGERLKAIINGFALSKVLSAEFKFFWKEKKGIDASFHAIDDVYKIFSKKFIDDHCVTSDEAEWLENRAVTTANLNEAKSKDHNVLKVEQRFDFSGLTNFHYGMYFSQIEFSENIVEVIKASEKFSTLSPFNAIHIRGGDIVYGRYRLFERFQRKAMPAPLAYLLADRFKAEGKQVIIFAQDKETKNLFNKNDFIIIDESYYDAQWSTVDIAFFEIMLMSKAEIIVSGASGFSDLAAKISDNRVRSYQDFFENDECYKLIEKFIQENDDKMGKLQKSFSYYTGYNISRDSMSTEERCNFLQNAFINDPINYSYLIRLILECLESHNHDDAERHCLTFVESIKTLDDFRSFMTALEAAFNATPQSKIVVERLANNLDYATLSIFKKLTFLVNEGNDLHMKIAKELSKEKSNLDVRDILSKVSVYLSLETRA